MPKISILGLDEYTEGHVWDDLVLPVGTDANLVRGYICMQCAELGLVYTDPATMQTMIGIWSNKNLDSWTRIKTALDEQYNPTYNYDRHEDWTDSSSGTSSTEVAGFNYSAGMADRDAAHSSGTGTHSGHIFGNIGVVSAMSLIREELELRSNFTLYDTILESFKNQFCILVY